MVKDRRLWVAGVPVLCLVGWFVWPTPWVETTEIRQTKGTDHYPVRIRTNLVTGERQTLLSDGWVSGEVIFD